MQSKSLISKRVNQKESLRAHLFGHGVVGVPEDVLDQVLSLDGVRNLSPSGKKYSPEIHHR